MEISEPIGKDRIPRLLLQLEEDRTILKMRLLGTDYERLTIITGVRVHGASPCFLIDYAEGFSEAVSTVEPWRFLFEFRGQDDVFYVFRTTGGQFSEAGDIQINFPGVIERIQRRKDFRVPATPSVKMSLGGKYASRMVTVIDISAGGALISSGDTKDGEAAFSTGQILKNIWLEFPNGELRLKAQIQEAVVKRSATEVGNPRSRYALQFTDVEGDAQIALNKIVYALQREHLRKRQDCDLIRQPQMRKGLRRKYQ